MSTELSKATLERKDKDELTQIAAAMGGKPGSRARKAEIVDLILDLAGVGDAPANTDTDTDTRSGDEPQGYTADPMADARAEAQGEGTSGRSNRVASANGSRANSGTTPDEGDTPAAKDGGASGGGSGDAEQTTQESGETGNRKRRRRGRNRGGNDGNDDWNGEPAEVEGYLDLRDDGYGFLRVKGFLPSKEDVYVSVKQVRQFGLRKGDQLSGAGRPANRSEKNPALVRIDAVNGREPDQAVNRVEFDELTAVFPEEVLTLSSDDADPTGRIIDLIAPVGKGQRGLIVSAPRTGQTSVLKQVARSIEKNHPDLELVVLLVDERPEEVTEMRRSLDGADVIASTFDRPPDEHTAVAELTLERAKRMVETGRDVVLLVDGITRLARSYNTTSSGRMLPSGIDPIAIHPAKRLFGAARKVEEGGSLTVLATALVDTGSSVDEAIFEEFDGTATMELRLDRLLAGRGLHPAIDVLRSATRSEGRLVGDAELATRLRMREALSSAADGATNAAPLELLLEALAASNDNAAVAAKLAKAASR